MNKPMIETTNREKNRKALPKSKALTNKAWGSRGGNGNEPGTVQTTGCMTMGCSGHCKTKAVC
jgi:hypothetical protein